jgi:hypothetical protein
VNQFGGFQDAVSVAVARQHQNRVRRGRVVPGGDSACGFANTAMQLASQGMLPGVLAAVVRAASAVRSLKAFSCGAVGPSKDCAYEGVRRASPVPDHGGKPPMRAFQSVGNVAAALCDLWSNESVQNVRLSRGRARGVLESSSDCRVMNQARSPIHRPTGTSSWIPISPSASGAGPLTRVDAQDRLGHRARILRIPPDHCRRA